VERLRTNPSDFSYVQSPDPYNDANLVIYEAFGYKQTTTNGNYWKNLNSD